MEIGQYEMYPEDSKYVDQVLYEMATKPIKEVGMYYVWSVEYL